MGKSNSKLFLSADLVGSTHYKQTQPGWQQVFLTFYWEFPELLRTAERETRNSADEKEIEFRLWKAVGDELIFEVTVASESTVARAVRVWLYALDLYQEQTLGKAKGKLALKGGAFIATFPGPDSEASVPRKPQDKTGNTAAENSSADVVIQNDEALKNRALTRYLFDYFGPSIDTGFRVFSHASRRYFTLSVEVAWVMAVAASNHATGHGHITHPTVAADNTTDHRVTDFVYLGEKELKGVWGGRAYPLFAIDRDCHDGVNQALRGLSTGEVTSARVIAVGQACINDASWPFRVYLPEAASSSQWFKTEPVDAMEQLRNFARAEEGAEEFEADPGGDDLPADAPLGLPQERVGTA